MGRKRKSAKRVRDGWKFVLILAIAMAFVCFFGWLTTAKAGEVETLQKLDSGCYTQIQLLKNNSNGLEQVYKDLVYCIAEAEARQDARRNMQRAFALMHTEVLPYFAAQSNMVMNKDIEKFLLYTVALDLTSRIFLEIRRL